MNRPQTWILVLCVVGFVWAILIAVMSIPYRRRNGVSIVRPSFDQPLFLETWKSGYCRSNFFLRFGSARNCLWVLVNDGWLHVAPHFPFNLFGASIWKLEFSVPASAIKAVKKVDDFGGNVRVTFERTPGTVEEFDLMLDAPSKFVAAVESLRQAAHPLAAHDQGGPMA